ncbi:hypothetical protein D3C84_873770 [compost metagenome]
MCLWVRRRRVASRQSFAIGSTTASPVNVWLLITFTHTPTFVWECHLFGRMRPAWRSSSEGEDLPLNSGALEQLLADEEKSRTRGQV